MIKKIGIVLSTVAAIGMAGSAQAVSNYGLSDLNYAHLNNGPTIKKNAPTILAEITAKGCSLEQIAPFGTSLTASWDWDNTVGESEGGQSKFGGDAEYTVELTVFGTPVELEVEFELVQFVRGTLAEDYAGQMVYRCTKPQTDTTGTCNSSVLGVRAALKAAVENMGYLWSDLDKATLEGVTVKAMKGKGRQNYPKVDVCDIL